MLTDPTLESILTDNTMEGLEANQRLEDLLGQEAVKMGQTILLIQVRLSLITLIVNLNRNLPLVFSQVPSAEGQTQVKTIEVAHQ